MDCNLHIRVKEWLGVAPSDRLVLDENLEVSLRAYVLRRGLTVTPIHSAMCKLKGSRLNQGTRYALFSCLEAYITRIRASSIALPMPIATY